MKATNYLKIVFLAVPVLLISCRGQISSEQPIHPNPNMDQQRRFEAQESNPFFENNRSMRLPVEGTVARGHLRQNTVYYQGITEDSSFVTDIPVEVTKAFIRQGQNQYNIYCTPCHGILGNGQGIIMTGQYGFVQAPSFHIDRIRNMPDGQLYSIITNGVRTMPSYAHQIKVENRWAIVSYLRALQRSQHIPEGEIKRYDVDWASLREKYKEQQAKQQALKEAQAAAGGQEEASAARGKQIAQQNNCDTCHSTDGSQLIGPTWQNLFGHEVTLQNGTTVTADEDYIVESIVSPQAKTVEGYPPVMTSYDFLSQSEIQSLVEYIKSLSENAGQ